MLTTLSPGDNILKRQLAPHRLWQTPVPGLEWAHCLCCIESRALCTLRQRMVYSSGKAQGEIAHLSFFSQVGERGRPLDDGCIDEQEAWQEEDHVGGRCPTNHVQHCAQIRHLEHKTPSSALIYDRAPNWGRRVRLQLVQSSAIRIRKPLLDVKSQTCPSTAT